MHAQHQLMHGQWTVHLQPHPRHVAHGQGKLQTQRQPCVQSLHCRHAAEYESHPHVLNSNRNNGTPPVGSCLQASDTRHLSHHGAPVTGNQSLLWALRPAGQPACQPARQLLNGLTILTSYSGAVGKAQFVEIALWELSVSLCRGNHHIVAAYVARNGRMTGSAVIPGLPVPIADAEAMDSMCIAT